MAIVKVKCTSCGGTGIHKDIDEKAPSGGVICSHCHGDAFLTFKKFTGRKLIKGITSVRGSHPIHEAAGTGPEINYKEFLVGKLPRDYLREVTYIG